MNIDPISPRRGAERIDESIIVGVVETVVQLPVGLLLFQFRNMRQEWRNADTAGDQQMFSRLWFDGEQVVGRGHRQGIARAHLLVHKARAAFGRRLKTHRNLPAGGIQRRAHQRIGVTVALLAILHLDDNMAAAAESRQRGAGRRHQRKTLHLGGDLFNIANDRLKHLIIRHR